VLCVMCGVSCVMCVVMMCVVDVCGVDVCVLSVCHVMSGMCSDNVCGGCV